MGGKKKKEASEQKTIFSLFTGKNREGPFLKIPRRVLGRPKKVIITGKGQAEE